MMVHQGALVLLNVATIYMALGLCKSIVERESFVDAKGILALFSRRRVWICVILGYVSFFLQEGMVGLLLGISLGCFCFGVCSDLTMKHAYRFGWLLVYGACALGFCARDLPAYVVLELFLFAALQFFWFSRFYGKADCHGFVAGAMILGLFGGRFRDYVMQMTYAFFLLFVVQAFRRNINRVGNLKEPVAFLPYVAAGLSFALLNLFGCS